MEILEKYDELIPMALACMPEMDHVSIGITLIVPIERNTELLTQYFDEGFDFGVWATKFEELMRSYFENGRNRYQHHVERVAIIIELARLLAKDQIEL